MSGEGVGWKKANWRGMSRACRMIWRKDMRRESRNVDQQHQTRCHTTLNNGLNTPSWSPATTHPSPTCVQLTHKRIGVRIHKYQYKLKKDHTVSARHGHIFANRIINAWNSLPDYSVTSPTVACLKYQLKSLNFSLWCCFYLLRPLRR